MELPIAGSSSVPPLLPRRGRLASSVSLLGACTTTVAASACCWLPLALATLGFSSAGAIAFFFEYRPLLLATSAVLLVVAWWFTLTSLSRRSSLPAATTASGCCGSTPGTLCGTTSGQVRGRIALLAVVSLFALVSGLRPDFLFSKTSSAAPPSLKHGESGYVVTIEGMDCECAAPALEKQLRDSLNEARIHMDVKPRRVLIPYDDCGPTKQEIRFAVEKAGYTVARIEGVPAATAPVSK